MKYNISAYDLPTYNIKVLDAFMGTGKTSSLLAYFRHNIGGKYLFVTPYILEDHSYLRASLKECGFWIADNDEGGKYDFCLNALQNNKSVCITHALFKYPGKDIIRLLIDKRYAIFIDEVPEVSQPLFYNMPKNLNEMYKMFDFDESTLLLSTDKTRNISPKIVYSQSMDASSVIDRLIWHAQNNTLAYSAGNLVSVPDLSYWSELASITIMTHRFEHSLFYHWMKRFNLAYEHIDSSALGLQSLEAKRKMLSLITHNKNTTSLDVALSNTRRTPFSFNWYTENSRDELSGVRSSLEYMVKQSKRMMPIDARNVFWTAPKSNLHKIEGRGYPEKHGMRNNYVAFNIRGSNEFRDYGVCMNLIDIYLDPTRAQLCGIAQLGKEAEEHSLNTLLQMLYRGRVRCGKEQTLILPSKRMTTLYDDYKVSSNW